MARVIVIGGGISGLSCALNLADQRPDLSVRVLEASGRLGGTIHTDRDGGFICETGPGAYIDRDPSTRRLIERLGLTDEVFAAGNAVRRRYIRHDGALHRYPDCAEAVSSSDLLSEHGRKRMLLAPISPALSDGEDWTVSEFARAHLGPEAATMLLDPIVGGIYAGDADQLSAASVLPQLVAHLHHVGLKEPYWSCAWLPPAGGNESARTLQQAVTRWWRDDAAGCSAAGPASS